MYAEINPDDDSVESVNTESHEEDKKVGEEDEEEEEEEDEEEDEARKVLRECIKPEWVTRWPSG